MTDALIPVPGTGIILNGRVGVNSLSTTAIDEVVSIASWNGHQIVSPFSELTMVERTPIVELNSAYGLTALRDTQTKEGNATITATGAEYALATTALANDRALLETAERGRYLPGYAAQAGIGARIATDMTGQQVARWGLFIASDGAFFGQDATGLFVATRKGSTDSKVYQTAWNLDKLDGTGKSGYTLDIAEGHIFHINFSWYGYGTIEFAVMVPDPSTGEQREVPVHRLKPSQTTSLTTPNLPIAAEVDNNATASVATLYVAGRQYSVEGRYRPQYRVSSARRLAQGSIGTTFAAALSVRTKSAFYDRAIKVEGLDIITTSANLLYELRLATTLGGSPSYGTPDDHTAAETAIEFDVGGTTVSGGNVIYQGLVSTAGAGQTAAGSTSIDGLGLVIPAGQAVTVAVRAVSGTATVDTVLRIKEEW